MGLSGQQGKVRTLGAGKEHGSRWTLRAHREGENKRVVELGERKESGAGVRGIVSIGDKGELMLKGGEGPRQRSSPQRGGGSGFPTV